jgi:hypothetical protein
MMKQIAVSAAAVIALTTSAYATSLLSETASPIAKITQGHGNPGDTASSTSDPNVTFRVLDNGKVERTNSRYGIVSYIDPNVEFQKTRGRDSRGRTHR